MDIYNVPFYVYKITCLATSQYYFGSRSAHARFNRNPKDDLLIKYFSSSRSIKDLIKKYDLSSFVGEILFESYSRDEIFWQEQDYIKQNYGDHLMLNSYYVDKESAKRVFGWTEENLEKMKKKIHAQVAAGKHNFCGGDMQRAAQLRLLNEGKHTSQDQQWLEKIRAKARSAETRQKKRDAMRAYYNDPEKYEEYKKRITSPIYKENHSQGMRRYYQENPEKRMNNGIKSTMTKDCIEKRSIRNKFNNRTNPNGKWFICENTGDIFCNRHHAEEVLNISSSSVGLVLNGRWPELKGLRFRYLTTEEVAEWLKSPQYQTLVQLYKPLSADQK